MKLYDKIIIFGQEVSVEYSDRVIDEHNANYIDGKILIHPRCKEKELARVFLHEVLHAICERTSISQAVSTDSEEMICDLISKALVENFHIRFK